LKLKYDKLLSNFAFNCNLRHYIKECITSNGGSLAGLSEKSDLIAKVGGGTG
jgi:hypothetical protein